MEHMFAQLGYAGHPREDLSSRVHWSKVGKLNDNELSLKEKWLHGFFIGLFCHLYLALFSVKRFPTPLKTDFRSTLTSTGAVTSLLTSHHRYFWKHFKYHAIQTSGWGGRVRVEDVIDSLAMTKGWWPLHFYTLQPWTQLQPSAWPWTTAPAM